MKLGIDYIFQDDMKEDTAPIKLLTGPYKDVVFRFTNVQIREQEDGTAKCLFAYELYKTGNHSEVYLRNSDMFTEHIGIILNDLILQYANATIAQEKATK